MSTSMSMSIRIYIKPVFPVRSSFTVALLAPASSLLATARSEHTVLAIPVLGTSCTDPYVCTYSGRPESGIRFEIEGLHGRICDGVDRRSRTGRVRNAIISALDGGVCVIRVLRSIAASRRTYAFKSTHYYKRAGCYM